MLLILFFCFFIFIFLTNRFFSNLLSIFLSFFLFISFLFFFLLLLPVTANYQFIIDITFFELLNFLTLGIDNLSGFFIFLVTFIMPFCFLYNFKNVFIIYKEFIFLLFFIECALVLLFLVTDLFWFYIFFEVLLLPFFLIIIIFGYRKRKNHAAYMFLFFTIVGSIFMLLGILLLYSLIGSVDFRLLSCLSFDWVYQFILWLFFFVGLFVKVPVIPVHIWLPEAHVEAPTVGSVILASLLLKLSFYGFLRILLTFFPVICIFMEPFIMVLAFSSIIWSSLICLRQVDLKKLIAYSSVVHMNIALIGLLLTTYYGIAGSILLCLSHGFISGGLFFCAGFFYDRLNTRNLVYYGGFSKVMPFFSFFFFCFCISNASFPGFLSFIGELLVIISLPYKTVIFTFLLGFLFIFGTLYSIWVFDHIFNGILKNIECFYDLTRFEIFLIFPLILITVFFGFFPNFLLDKLVFVSLFLMI